MGVSFENSAVHKPIRPLLFLFCQKSVMNELRKHINRKFFLFAGGSYQYTARRLLDGALSRSFGFRILYCIVSSISSSSTFHGFICTEIEEYVLFKNLRVY